MDNPVENKTPDKNSKDSAKPSSSEEVAKSPAPTENLSATNVEDDSGALERLPDDIETSSPNSGNTTFNIPSFLSSAKKPVVKDKPFKKFRDILKQFDIYILIFALFIIISAVAVIIGIEKNKASTNSTISTQTLDQNALSELNNNDTQVGGNGQTLTIQADTVFSGSALIKGDLQVAGGLKVGGTLSLPGIQVSGASKLGSLDADTISIAGAGSVAGQLTVQQSLTVNGPTIFNGPVSAPQITVSNLQVNGDILISHHLVTTGSIPVGTTLSSIGSGGTTSVNGTDTSGTIDINTGTNAAAGCLIKVEFSKAYANAPNVVITMIATTAQTPPQMSYYLEKSSTGFSLCSQNPPSNATFGFDYITVD